MSSNSKEPAWWHGLPQLLSESLGSKAKLASYKVVKQNQDQVVLVGRLVHQRDQVIIKLARPGSSFGASYERTTALHKLVAAETDIEMADVLAVNVTCQQWPWQYLIKTYIPGQEWGTISKGLTGEALSDAYRQIGHAVGQLHTIQLAEFGEFTKMGGVQGNRNYLTALKDHARHIITPGRLLGIFLTALEDRSACFSTIHRPCLCHEDLHQHNILFRNQGGRWRLATILDFDKAWAGHNESDLARLELWRGMMHPAFWDAYKTAHFVDENYTIRRPIHQLLWCLEVAWPTAQHLADMARVCAELELPPIERFDDD